MTKEELTDALREVLYGDTSIHDALETLAYPAEQRDKFAQAALQGLLASGNILSPQEAAEAAVEYAIALDLALERMRDVEFTRNRAAKATKKSLVI